MLEQYVSGEREPVQGPLVYADALQLVEMAEKLLGALKEVIAGYQPIDRVTKAKYFNACATIVEAEELL
jgi:hypothetical protein